MVNDNYWDQQLARCQSESARVNGFFQFSSLDRGNFNDHHSDFHESVFGSPSVSYSLFLPSSRGDLASNPAAHTFLGEHGPTP